MFFACKGFLSIKNLHPFNRLMQGERILLQRFKKNFKFFFGDPADAFSIPNESLESKRKL